MNPYFTKPVYALLVTAAVVCVLFVDSKGHLVSSSASEVNTLTEVTLPQKTENISVDYAQSHEALMEKSEDVRVSSF